MEGSVIHIKKLIGEDLYSFIELINVFEEVFEMEKFSIPNSQYLQTLLEKDDFGVFAAVSDHEIVGGLTTYTLHQYYSASPLIYIYDLAVKPSYQRRGIGKKLISAVIDFAKTKGADEVFVQADADELHATEFYHSTGGIPEPVIHFNYPLKNDNLRH